MIKREKYIDDISEFIDVNSLIKIIYGIRRSGKSVILTQIIDKLKLNSVDDNQIIYINFESLEYNFIKTAKDLDSYVKSLIKTSKVYYLFLDEVQYIEDFEKALNSLRITDQISIFVTGSNSRVTFSELASDLSGRYVSFKVRPLSFKEVVNLTNTTKENYEKLLFDILEWGTLPQRFMFDNENARINYIKDVYNSVVLSDVVQKLGIKDINSFNKILQYLLETEGREFSSDNILNYLNSNHITMSSQTLYVYLNALCSSFILNKVNRYDIKGKAVLKTLSKFYVEDLAIKKIKSNGSENNYSIALENLVYNELLKRDYEIYVGKTTKGEIDFMAKKNNEQIYIQVSLYLENEITINREFGAFDFINDNNPKYVISLDKINYSRNGIKHVNIFDFLLSDVLK